ncbi:type II toxin-antitoxin system death-on-curing family toxin [Wohlfahrtiimonas chitiniclastica]|uniref:type II toxin-antitoxin system death-on-curing family toxin n=1 Tax=Wohlfahrtiimonas chitiniclastica TaxID=400946 RepID=UPI001BCC8F9E|nr:type II toxin-antitoxin system death-on-curing family toxin [Wohlfahrtiimonas chitiniclastica]MBS7815932.1 type II toxin-antitoxin system death-on-curing family toxin [Wohlfahrtiimonas chitiniclastica]MBS7822073.1 type II toxin-antitoxin system death-on-curing family toxin [Wohlfahrtiimonas chitiniclastica]MBS7829865.1 type II toxin-antitoxin system death-on-curing family toxin [Wohlfahrtiimonas chitiniclastica]MBS7831832.1 type II toxin-antitoxin system death-on-curing family toxin [Wohlfah
MTINDTGSILEDGSIHYLTEDDITQINIWLIKKDTPEEPIQVINPVGLSSSASRPSQYRNYEQTEDMFKLAAVLIESLIKNHCFANANKRTAMQAGAMFLLLNGYELIPIESYEYAYTAEGVATGKYDTDYLERWLYYHSSDFNTLQLC